MATAEPCQLPAVGLCKAPAALRRLMEPKNLAHFFKCMDSGCSFSSDDDDLFLVHLSAHRDQAPLCVYCGHLATSAARLVKHMVTAHSLRKAQCSLCLYRARTKMHLIVHAAVAHEGTVMSWYSCRDITPPVEKPISPGDVTDLWSARRRCKARSLMSSLDIVQSLKTKQLMLDLLATSRLPKTLAAFSSQLEPAKVIHFFKCMETSCDYSTDDDDLFLVHLAAHQERPFSCCYCGKLTSSEARLIKHLVAAHGSCSFQCPLCFYRAYSKTHVIIHTLVVHRSKLVRWYSCKARAPIAVAPNPHVAPDSKFYVCGEDCSFSCLSPKVFVSHLTEKHSSCQWYACHVCLKKAESPTGLIQHYADVHSFHFVQCFHCSFGRETEWDVLTHVAEGHANKPFKVLLRSGEAAEVFRRIKGLSKAPRHAPPPPQPPDSSTVQHTAKTNDSFEPASGHEEELAGAAAECASVSTGAMTCGLRTCIKTFSTVLELLNHLPEDHRTGSEFSCPLCSRLKDVPLEPLRVHIVDTHTDLACCPYKECLFLSESQQSIDDHIMQAHQRFGSDEVELPNELEESAPLETEEPQCSEDKAVDSSETYDSAHKTDETQTENLYNCSMCYQEAMPSQDYFRHLSFGHGIKFFCGHCEKGYKGGRLLLLHHKRHHPGLPASVKSYEDNQLSEVSPSILSGLEEEKHFLDKKDKTMKKPGRPLGRKKVKAAKQSNGPEENSASQEAREGSTPGQEIKGPPNSGEQQEQDHQQIKSLSCGLQRSGKDVKRKSGIVQKSQVKGTDVVKKKSDVKTEERMQPASHTQDSSQGSVPHLLCGHCFKAYKLVKSLVSHINTIHPGLPVVIKRMDVARLEDVANVDQLLERRGCYDVSGEVACDQKVPCKNDSVKDECAPVDCDNRGASPPLQHRRKRGVAVLTSDSESDVPQDNVFPPWKTTISYYGREIEHVDYENIFVRMQGDVKVPYCQLAHVLKFQPIVRAKKLCYKL
ncbi:unnamed protein product [Ixodes hexagonus]